MFYKLCQRVGLVSLLIIGSMLFTTTVSADSVAEPAGQAVNIAALCRDDQSQTAQWRVGNPNPEPVTISWPAAGAATNDSVVAPYGYTTFATSFDNLNQEPVVGFEQAGYPEQLISVSELACAPADESCVDGYNRDNLQLDWSTPGSVTIATKDAALLCDDVTVYFSNYTLPATYDHSGIFNDSAVPQNLFDSTSALLKKGTTGQTTLTIATPNACTDYQLDAYYAPEITTVSYHGHGAQLIYGTIYVRTATDCSAPETPPTTGGLGGGDTGAVATPTSPATPEPAVVVATPAPTLSLATPRLQNTGQSNLLPTFVAALVSLLAVASYRPASRQKVSTI